MQVAGNIGCPEWGQHTCGTISTRWWYITDYWIANNLSCIMHRSQLLPCLLTASTILRTKGWIFIFSNVIYFYCLERITSSWMEEMQINSDSMCKVYLSTQIHYPTACSSNAPNTWWWVCMFVYYFVWMPKTLDFWTSFSMHFLEEKYTTLLYIIYNSLHHGDIHSLCKRLSIRSMGMVHLEPPLSLCLWSFL